MRLGGYAGIGFTWTQATALWMLAGVGGTDDAWQTRATSLTISLKSSEGYEGGQAA